MIYTPTSQSNFFNTLILTRFGFTVLDKMILLKMIFFYNNNSSEIPTQNSEVTTNNSKVKFITLEFSSNCKDVLIVINHLRKR